VKYLKKKKCLVSSEESAHPVPVVNPSVGHCRSRAQDVKKFVQAVVQILSSKIFLHEEN
jgi:hypothetical protein